MLKNDFYTIKSQEVSTDLKSVKTLIELNRAHDIFKGHFPEIPVVPGVCTVQIIKEIVSETINKELMLVQGNNIKLHNPINPDHTLYLNIDISIIPENDLYHVNAEVHYEKLKFCSFRGDFK